jgi:hypothetical protein|tara:strand:+ start:253 stop:519 length:267 start_codon:yes stop_codon:yes gene_type:complete
MKIVTWNRDHGFTFAVMFANGNSGAEYVAKNPKTGKKFEWTEAQAVAAGEKFRTVKGDNWELGNLNYNVTDPSTGEQTKLFQHVNFTI